MMQEPTQLESCLIASSKKNSPSEPVESVETGIFVRSIMKFTNLDFVYVFDQPLTGNQVEKLKTSLQQVLVHYPTLSGRVQGNQVLLNNQGASFTVQAMPKGCIIQDIPKDPPTGTPFCHIPIPKEQIQGKAPLLTITVTQFDDGWTLGVVILHLVADAWTFAMFVKDWSEIYNSRDIEKIQYHLPSVMLELHPTKQDADEAALNDLNWVSMPWLKQVLFKGLFRHVLPSMMKDKDPRLGEPPKRIVLHYSASQLRQIKKMAESVAKTWVSTNEALMAHVWHVLADAAQLTKEQRSNLGASFAINLRSKLPGISPRLIGNVVTSSRLENDLSTDGEIPLERQIHDQMRLALTEEKLRTTMMVSNRAWTDTGPCDLYVTKKAGDLLFGGIPGVLNWNWQASNPYFDVDFGSGPPLRGIPWYWKQPLTVLPNPSNGVDVYIDCSERGPVAWKRLPSKWSNIARLCGLLSLSSSLFLLKSSRSNWPGAGVCLVTFSLLSLQASSYAKKDAEESQQDFHDYVKANAHRRLKA